MSEIALKGNDIAASKSNYQEHPELLQQNEEWFDLTSIEKKLCAISLGSGIVLLGIFLAAFRL